MLSYETLDAIADTYLPTLVVLAIISSIPASGRTRLLTFAWRVSTLAALALLAYGLMYLDDQLRLWPRLGLDYSTHTALAVSLVIWLDDRWPTARIVWWSSLSLYVALMLYQRYHTTMDIVSTVAVIAPIAWLIVRSGRTRLDQSSGEKEVSA